MRNGDKDAEILALRHQLSVLQRSLVRTGRGSPRVIGRCWRRCCTSSRGTCLRDCTWWCARIPCSAGTAIWSHAGTPSGPGSGARAGRARALYPRPGVAAGPRESRLGVSPGARRAAGAWDKGRRFHRLGKLHEAGIDPAPERSSTTWADFLRSQAGALLACDFFETVTLSGVRLHVFAVIEHASRRIRILGATAHPAASWVAQAARNLVMDLEDAGCRAQFLIRDRDGKFPGLFGVILADAGIDVVLSGVRTPRMNSIMERWVQTCRHELLDRTLIWNQPHLLHALREFELFYNGHRPHQGIANARPLQPLPVPLVVPDQIASLGIRRHDRLGGVLHEYQHAA